MKLKPFQDWVQGFLDEGYKVHSYVAIRADEPYRTGYDSNEEKLIIKLPFREDGIDKPGVMDILENSGVGLPSYYEWRTRSGCTFCFFQRKIEWVGLLERYPEVFEKAMEYEKKALANHSPFTWSERESLEELSRPERVAEIKADHEKKVAKMKKRIKVNPLRPDGEPELDMDDIYGQGKVCMLCHK